MNVMPERRSLSDNLSPDEVERAREWVAAWKRAGPALEEIRRRELRQLDSFAAISLLCGPADYTVAPRAPKPTSGLIEQQRLFARAHRR